MYKRKRPRIVYAYSFCSKNQDYVQRFIAGPHGVYVCDWCIERFGKVDAHLQEESGSTTKSKSQKPSQRLTGWNILSILKAGVAVITST